MGPGLVVITRLGPLLKCRDNYQPFPHIIIKRAGPNYYVRKRVIISSAFVVMSNGPNPCNHYKAWAHYCYKCRRNYHPTFDFGPDWVRKGQPIKIWVRKGQPIRTWVRKGQPIRNWTRKGQSIRNWGRKGQPIRTWDRKRQPIRNWVIKGQPIRTWVSQSEIGPKRRWAQPGPK